MNNGILAWGPEGSSRYYGSSRDVMVPIEPINNRLPQHLRIARKTPNAFFDHHGRQWSWAQLPEDIRYSWSIEEVKDGISIRPNTRNRPHAHLLVWRDGQLCIEEGTKAPPASEKDVLNQVAAALMRRCDMVSGDELDAWITAYLKGVSAAPLLASGRRGEKTVYYVLPAVASDVMCMAGAVNNPEVLTYVEVVNETTGGVTAAVVAHITRCLDDLTPKLLKDSTPEVRAAAAKLQSEIIPAYDSVFGILSNPAVAKGSAVLKAVMGV